jgi:N-acetylglutamate synthase-like GNAT family acetyltransferase
MLISNNQLNAEQLSALDDLANLCRPVDKDVPPLYKHILSQRRLSDSSFLYYEQDKLIGFLSIYFFYADASEVTVLVAPSHRRQGIAKQLIQAVLPLIEEKEIEHLYFSTPAEAHNDWLSRLGFKYKNSEYHMERNSFEPILAAKQTLSVRIAKETDIPELCGIDELCFPVEPENMPFRFMNIMEDDHYTILLAFREGKAVAKAHIRWEKDKVIFSDIAVRPEFQRKGLGGEILSYCINYALTLGKTKLALDVETSNNSALNLYTNHQFKIVNAIDFWTISAKELRALIP